MRAGRAREQRVASQPSRQGPRRYHAAVTSTQHAQPLQPRAHTRHAARRAALRAPPAQAARAEARPMAPAETPTARSASQQSSPISEPPSQTPSVQAPTVTQPSPARPIGPALPPELVVSVEAAHIAIAGERPAADALALVPAQPDYAAAAREQLERRMGGRFDYASLRFNARSSAANALAAAQRCQRGAGTLVPVVPTRALPSWHSEPALEDMEVFAAACAQEVSMRAQDLLPEAAAAASEPPPERALARSTGATRNDRLRALADARSSLSKSTPATGAKDALPSSAERARHAHAAHPLAYTRPAVSDGDTALRERGNVQSARPPAAAQNTTAQQLASRSKPADPGKKPEVAFGRRVSSEVAVGRKKAASSSSGPAPKRHARAAAESPRDRPEATANAPHVAQDYGARTEVPYAETEPSSRAVHSCSHMRPPLEQATCSSEGGRWPVDPYSHMRGAAAEAPALMRPGCNAPSQPPEQQALLQQQQPQQAQSCGHELQHALQQLLQPPVPQPPPAGAGTDAVTSDALIAILHGLTAVIRSKDAPAPAAQTAQPRAQTLAGPAVSSDDDLAPFSVVPGHANAGLEVHDTRSLPSSSDTFASPSLRDHAAPQSRAVDLGARVQQSVSSTSCSPSSQAQQGSNAAAVERSAQTSARVGSERARAPPFHAVQPASEMQDAATSFGTQAKSCTGEHTCTADDGAGPDELAGVNVGMPDLAISVVQRHTAADAAASDTHMEQLQQAVVRAAAVTPPQARQESVTAPAPEAAPAAPASHTYETRQLAHSIAAAHDSSDDAIRSGRSPIFHHESKQCANVHPPLGPLPSANAPTRRFLAIHDLSSPGSAAGDVAQAMGSSPQAQYRAEQFHALEAMLRNDTSLPRVSDASGAASNADVQRASQRTDAHGTLSAAQETVQGRAGDELGAALQRKLVEHLDARRAGAPAAEHDGWALDVARPLGSAPTADGGALLRESDATEDGDVSLRGRAGGESFLAGAGAGESRPLFGRLRKTYAGVSLSHTCKLDAVEPTPSSSHTQSVVCVEQPESTDCKRICVLDGLAMR